VPGPLPDGDAVPVDGRLPATAYEGLGERPFGVYLHVPYCATRCGYCDFNTYTATELGGGASQATYVDTALAEVRLARKVLGDLQRPVDTVFVGGGTPTLLAADDLARLLDGVRSELGLAADAEVTTEANPESVDERYLAALREAGFTRVSLGMQSAVPHVLALLDRRHTPGRPEQCVKWAHAAGFEHVSLDLIYGAPGETDRDWATSLAAAISAQPDHLSAYSLIVEPGTRLHAQVQRGAVPLPDDDVLADRYLMADEALTAAGFAWYEVSNWASTESARCRHNELYWTGGDWWGVGPGAHSHIGGTRWWNVKHPAAYAERLSARSSPAYAREVLDTEARHAERVLLELRLARGLDLNLLDTAGRATATRAVADGLLDPVAHDNGRAVLTLRGRLLADGLVLALLT